MSQLASANEAMKKEVKQAKFASDLVAKLADDGILKVEESKVTVNRVEAPHELFRNEQRIDNAVEEQPVNDEDME